MQLQEWERSFTEPLAEYSQFSAIIKQLLKYRHNKHLQCEMTRDSLESKKHTLEELEQSELEARRLDQALDRALARVKPLDNHGNIDQPDHKQQPQEGQTPATTSTSTVAPPQEPSANLSASTSRKSASTSGGGKFGFLGALSHTLNGMVDSDPDMTRRNNIGKTRDSITQVRGGVFFVLFSGVVL